MTEPKRASKENLNALAADYHQAAKIRKLKFDKRKDKAFAPINEEEEVNEQNDPQLARGIMESLKQTQEEKNAKSGKQVPVNSIGDSHSGKSPINKPPPPFQPPASAFEVTDSATDSDDRELLNINIKDKFTKTSLPCQLSPLMLKD